MALDANEPVSLPEAKAWLKEDSSDNDAMIETLVVAARKWVERRIGQYLLQREVIDTFDDFSETINLTQWPVDPASVAVAYVDALPLTASGKIIRQALRERD